MKYTKEEQLAIAQMATELVTNGCLEDSAVKIAIRIYEEVEK